MLRSIHFNDQLGSCAIKVCNIAAYDSLFINFYRIFAEKKIPELALMRRHFSSKLSGFLQLTVILWYGHAFALSVTAAPCQLSQRESQDSRQASPARGYISLSNTR